jgi:hypothetical protein
LFDVIAENDRVTGPLIATQGQTAFPFDFPVAADEELQVARKRDGTAQVLLLAQDYTVARTASGGAVTLLTAALAADEITITGRKPVERDRAFTAGVHFEGAAAEALNSEFAAVVMMLQELRRDLATAGGGTGGGGPSLTAEQVQDIVGALIQGGSGASAVYDDMANRLTISVTAGGGGGLTAAQVRDVVADMMQAGSNVTLNWDVVAGELTISAATGGSGGGLTLEQVQDAVAAMIGVGPGLLVAYDDAAGTLTLSADTMAGGADAEVIRDVFAAAVETGPGIEFEHDDALNKLKFFARGKNQTPGLNQSDLVAAPLIARFFREVHIAADYGLSGDSAENATVKFQKAVDQLAGADCMGVLASGTYSIDRVTWAGEARLVLQGRAGGPTALNGVNPGSGQYVGAEIRALVPGQPALILGDANPATTDFRKAGHLLRDLQFVGQGAAAPLRAYNQISMQIQACNFLATAANAPTLDLFGSVQNDIEGCIFRNGPARIWPFFNPGDGGVMSSTTILIEGSLFVACEPHGLELYDSRGVTVSQCVIESCGTAGNVLTGGIFCEYLPRTPASNHGNFDNLNAPTLIVEDCWFEANRGLASIKHYGGMLIGRHCHFIANPLATHDVYVNVGGYAAEDFYFRTELAGRVEFREEGPGTVWGAAARTQIRGPNRLRVLPVTGSDTIPAPKPLLVHMDPNKSELVGLWQPYPVTLGTVVQPASMLPSSGGLAQGEYMRQGSDMLVQILYRFGSAQFFSNTGEQWAFTLPARSSSNPTAIHSNTSQIWRLDVSLNQRRFGDLIGIVSPNSSQLRLFRRDSSFGITQVTAPSHFEPNGPDNGDEITVTLRYRAVFQ